MSESTITENNEKKSLTENVIDTVREPLLAIDKDLRVIKASRSFYKFFKVTDEETIGKLIYELGNHQWDIPKLKELLEKIIPEKKSFDDYEVEHNFSTIGKRVMLLNARQVKRAFGKEKIILLAIEDITERKGKENSLKKIHRATSDSLNSLLNHMDAPIIIWDTSRVIKRFNHQFELLSGYVLAEVIDKKIDFLFPKDKINATLDLLKNHLANNHEVIEIDILTKDNHVKTVLWNSSHILDEKGINIIATISQDITSRKLTENALHLSEIRYRRLFESAKDGILILDAQTGKIIDVNPFLVDLLGYSKNKFIEKFIWEIGSFQDIYENHEKFLELQQKEYVRYDDLPLIASDGREIHVEFISNVYLANNIKVIQCNIRDISKRKQLENELIKAMERAEESDRLKTAFLNNISHEIRTPMNAIVGFSGFINEPGLMPEKRKHYTEIIEQSCNQLLAIIDDIISISSIEAGQEKIQENEININLICNLIKDQFSLKAYEKNVTLSLKSVMAYDEATIITDTTKLMQIITNLIGNALKFTPQGYVNYGYTVKDSLLEFYVEDSGIGIPLDMQEIIFDRFRQIETTATRNFGGSGLGLSISKAYVELLGGKMWLTSELGKGSVFYFTIPYKNTIPEKITGIPVNKEQNITLKTKTLLIAEDEDSNFMVLEIMLSGLGINIIRAVNGLEAVEFCKSNPHIDLVLMDLKMPGMDGYEATIRIKEFRPELSIIAQTAYSTVADSNKALASGCSDYISKPFSKEELLFKINEQYK